MLVPFKILRGLLKGVCKEKTRLPLCGVNLSRTGLKSRPAATVTDGRTLVQCRWNEDDASEYPADGLVNDKREGWSFTVPTEVVKAAVAADPKSFKPVLNNTVVEELPAGAGAKVFATDLETKTVLETRGIEAEFPPFAEKIREVRAKSETVAKVDIAKLKQVCDVLLAIHDKKKDAHGEKVLMAEMKFGHGQPITFLIEDDGKSTGALIMPMIVKK